MVGGGLLLVGTVDVTGDEEGDLTDLLVKVNGKKVVMKTSADVTLMPPTVSPHKTLCEVHVMPLEDIFY